MIVNDYIRGNHVQSAGHNCKINPQSMPQNLSASRQDLDHPVGAYFDNDHASLTVHYLAYYMAVDYQINKQTLNIDFSFNYIKGKRHHGDMRDMNLAQLHCDAIK